jgi:phosphate transport system permease protein
MANIAKSSNDSESKSINLVRNPKSLLAIFELVMTGIASTFIVITLIPLFAVLFYVVIKGGSRLNLDLFTQLPPVAGQTTGGIASAILGTIQVVSIATLIAVPFGILAAIFLSEFGGNGQAVRWIRFTTNVLSGVPSIIVGVFAYSFIVLKMGSFSVLAGSIALSVLMLPTIIRTTDEALQIVPQEIRWASVGVGASNYQTVLQVVLPACLPAILTGVTLAIARAAGETAPLLFTVIYTNNWPTGSLLSPTLPSLSYLVYEFARGFDRVLQEFAWAGSLVLVGLVLLTSIIARLATRQKQF